MANYTIDFVIKLALILLLSILPSLVYLAIFRKAKERWQMRLRRAQILTTYSDRHRESFRNNAYYYDRESYIISDRRRPITKYFIGDTTCANNARSPYIRCAINPSGPCDDCSHYEKRAQN